MKHEEARRRLVRAAAIADGTGLFAAPGVVLLEGQRVVAAGAPQVIGPVRDAVVLDHPSAVVMPALVNAHAHLDLTHLGPLPYGGDFCGWIETVRAGRAVAVDDIARSVRRGVELARAGGTGLIGDIAGAGSMVPLRVLRDAGLAGVSYLELFGTGEREAAAIARMGAAMAATPRSERGVRLGLQPHAPYSAGRGLYRAAAESGLPVSTHLAETREELAMVNDGSGPLPALLRRFGAWDEGFSGWGMHPIDSLADELGRTRWALAHCHYVDARHLEMLARWKASVVYCPRASAYFGHPVKGAAPHAWRSMIDAGINVALGTDSAACLDTPARISVVDEMGWLARREAADPLLLLTMATVNGARALGFDPAPFTLRPGDCGGLVAIGPVRRGGRDSLREVLRAEDATISWVMRTEPHDRP